MLKLRYYQKDCIDSIFKYIKDEYASGKIKHPIVVLPTGTGKSLVQAIVIKRMLEYDKTRVLCLTHQKYLIEQNYIEFLENIDHDMFIDAGIYSAGLKKKDTDHRVIFAGIQSVYKKAWHLGHFDMVLIDECHLIPHDSEGMYRNFLSECEKINPHIVCVGLSATPYRMKSGFLHEGDNTLFDSIVYDVTIPELINPEDYRNRDKIKYLCKPISKSGVKKIDLSNVHLRGGEFKADEMENAYISQGLTESAVIETIASCHDRRQVLVFASGIKHAEEIKQEFIKNGSTADTVHSQKKENDEIIEKFKNQEIKYLINVNSLTTGFNVKSVDAIILMRSTLSPGLYVQMVGRGFRLFPGKENFLVLDFGRNIETHGPIDKIVIRHKKGGGLDSDVTPCKECPECHEFPHAAVRVCSFCGFEFPENEKNIEKTASESSIISEYKPPIEVDVGRIEFMRHEKRNGTGTPSLKVLYYESDISFYAEWICIEHEGFAKRKALQWLKQRTDMQIDSINDAIYKQRYFRKSKKIFVDLNGKFPRIVSHHLETKQEYDERVLEDLPL